MNVRDSSPLEVFDAARGRRRPDFEAVRFSVDFRTRDEDVSLREWGLNEGILTVVNGQCRLASLN